MVLTCCVCGSRWREGGDISYHRFPKNPDKKQQWLNILKKTGDPTYWRICSRHFKNTDYTVTMTGVPGGLSSVAVPSRKLGRIVRSKYKTNSITNKNVKKNKENHVDSDNILHEPLDVESQKNMNLKELFGNNADMVIIVNSPRHSVSDSELSSHGDEDVQTLEDTDVSILTSNDHDYCHDVIEETCQHTETPVLRQTISSLESSKVGLNRRYPVSKVWSDLAYDDEFLKYKRISDVKWENVVNDPEKATLCWEVAVETIEDQKHEIKKLRAKLNWLESKVGNLQSLVEDLKNKDCSETEFNCI